MIDAVAGLSVKKVGLLVACSASPCSDWKSGRVEEWKSGRVEEWKSGRVEEWKSGRVEEWKSRRETLYREDEEFRKCEFAV